jgi:hypothetical protein
MTVQTAVAALWQQQHCSSSDSSSSSSSSSARSTAASGTSDAKHADNIHSTSGISFNQLTALYAALHTSLSAIITASVITDVHRAPTRQ